MRAAAQEGPDWVCLGGAGSGGSLPKSKNTKLDFGETAARAVFLFIPKRMQCTRRAGRVPGGVYVLPPEVVHDKCI
jgi:hypothetical protein